MIETRVQGFLAPPLQTANSRTFLQSPFIPFLQAVKTVKSLFYKRKKPLKVAHMQIASNSISFSVSLLNSAFFIDGKNLIITNFFYLKVFLVIIKVLITTFLMALFCPSVIQPVTIEIKGIGTNLIPPVQEAITINYFSYSMIFLQGFWTLIIHYQPFLQTKSSRKTPTLPIM